MNIQNAVFRMTALLMGFVCLLAAAAAAVPVSYAQSAATLPYDDMKQNFAASAILNVTNNQLMNGTGNRRFEPNKPVTRAEMTAMLDRMLGIQPVTAIHSSYTDVPVQAWYYEWIMPAVHLGIAQGVSVNLFEPSRAVTREEAAVLLARALKQPLEQAGSIAVPIYKDQDTIADWALQSVDLLKQLKLMFGDKDGFRPRDSITRQEAAVLLDRVWSHAGWAKQIQAGTPARIQLGWQYGQSTSQFEQQVLSSEVNTLSPRWYFWSAAGVFEDYTDASLVTWAHQNGKQVWAMVGNRSDERSTHQMLADPAIRTTFIQQLADRVGRYNIDGLNIDFEDMMPQDRDYFTAFVAELHKQLQSVNKVLSVNVSPDFGTDWTAVFDYNALAQQAEYIVLMGYDEHWGTSPQAGSVSSLPWLRQGLKKLLEHVPSGQIIAAFPLYTRDWAVNSEGKTLASDISLTRQNDIVRQNGAVLQWDERLGQYYTAYMQNSVLHQLWLEDSRSMSQKIAMAESNAVAGYAYWYMGGESTDLWTSVRNAVQYASISY